jgi:hypothetical protein
MKLYYDLNNILTINRKVINLCQHHQISLQCNFGPSGANFIKSYYYLTEMV